MLKRIAYAVMVLVAVSATASQAQQPAAPAKPAATPAAAQPVAAKPMTEADIAAMRAEMRSDKKQLVAVNLPLTDTEATKFWPIYDQYTTEITAFNDAKWAIIKQYAAEYKTMTDAAATDMITRWIGIDQSISGLRLKYIPIFGKVIPGKKVAMFMQIDRRISLLADLALAANIPMVQP